MLFTDDTIYLGNLIEFTEKLREQIGEFRKISDYKINIQKSLVFLISAMEIRSLNFKNNIIYHSIRNIKYLEINLIKHVRNLYHRVENTAGRN